MKTIIEEIDEIVKMVKELAELTSETFEKERAEENQVKPSSGDEEPEDDTDNYAHEEKINP